MNAYQKNITAIGISSTIGSLIGLCLIGVTFGHTEASIVQSMLSGGLGILSFWVSLMIFPAR